MTTPSSFSKIFYEYADGQRPIRVNVDKDYISFHFWKENDRVFYDLLTSEWQLDKTGREHQWHKHMMLKNWFNEEMKKFIDESVDKLFPND